MTSPTAVPLGEAARAALGELVGRPDVDFHDGQFEAIDALVEGRRRALVVQRTGWGKSAVYFVATLLRRRQGAGPTVLVSPLLALMRDQIAAAIIEGEYPEGEMLPSVRAFAAEQGANPLTVAKAYQQFQADGLVEVQRGVGMYVVAGAAERLRRAEREHFLAEEWPELRARMARLGIEPADLFERG